jgi:hypothetical protein
MDRQAVGLAVRAIPTVAVGWVAITMVAASRAPVRAALVTTATAVPADLAVARGGRDAVPEVAGRADRMGAKVRRHPVIEAVLALVNRDPESQMEFVPVPMVLASTMVGAIPK